jgi:hypothetical protein
VWSSAAIRHAPSRLMKEATPTPMVLPALLTRTSNSLRSYSSAHKARTNRRLTIAISGPDIRPQLPMQRIARPIAGLRGSSQPRRRESSRCFHGIDRRPRRPPRGEHCLRHDRNRWPIRESQEAHRLRTYVEAHAIDANWPPDVLELPLARILKGDTEIIETAVHVILHSAGHADPSNVR